MKHRFLRHWLVCAVLGGVGCSDPPESSPPSGPPGGIIDFDADSIPLGEGGDGQGGNSGSAASAGSSGSGVSSGGTSGRGSGGGGRQSSGGGGAQSGEHGGGRSGGFAGSAGAGGAGKRVGDLCDTDADCPAPMFCNIDSVDYIGHRQCALRCSSSADCRVAQGEDSFCIGAGFCVRGCTSGSACPSLTECNEALWCERGGPGSGVPSCTGFPTPCTLLSETTCVTARGCSDNSECGGFASSCYSQYSSYSCNSQDGCYWSISSESCSGSARSCRSASGRLTCGSQRGCYWNQSCTGIPESCESMGIARCSSQPGCSLEY